MRVVADFHGWMSLNFLSVVSGRNMHSNSKLVNDSGQMI